MSTQHDTDRLFAEHLRDFEAAPPPKAWDQIELALDKGKSKRTAIVIFRWMMAAGILLIVAIGTTLYFMKPNHTIHNDILSDNTIIKSNAIETSHTSEYHASATITKSINPTNNDQNTQSGSTLSTNTVNHSISINRHNSTLKTSASQTDNNIEYKVLNPHKCHLPENNSINTKNIQKEKKYLPLPNPNTLAMELFSPKENTTDPSWQIGAQVTPSYAYRTVNGATSNNESGMNTLNGGITLRMKKSKRLVFETGIVYAKAGQQIASHSVTPTNSFIFASERYAVNAQLSNITLNNSLGTISSKQQMQRVNTDDKTTNMYSSDMLPLTTVFSSDNLKIKQVLDYIELPLAARYYLASYKNANISISGGLSINLLIDNKALLIQNGETKNIGKTDNINTLSYSTKIGLGLDVPLSRNFIINVEPVFKYFISPVNHDSNTAFRPYTMGMNTGIIYKF
jgi:hypothetical protein